MSNDLLNENPLKSLSRNNEITDLKILNDLLNGKKDLDLKTQVDKPKELASLVSLAKHLKKSKYPISSGTIIKFIKKYLRYMVSFDRLSRTEIIHALTPSDSRMKDYMDKKFSTKLD